MSTPEVLGVALLVVKIGTDDWNTILIDHNRAPRLGGPSWGGTYPREIGGDVHTNTPQRPLESVSPPPKGAMGPWANPCGSHGTRRGALHAATQSSPSLEPRPGPPNLVNL